MQGDISAVAKALRDFARGNPHLVIKGGLADGSLLTSSDLAALADLPPREVLLARLAGALAAPMQQMAGLLQALPRNLAYGISALIEQREAGGETLPSTAEVPEAAAEPETAPAAEAEASSETETAETAETVRGRGQRRQEAPAAGEPVEAAPAAEGDAGAAASTEEESAE